MYSGGRNHPLQSTSQKGIQDHYFGSGPVSYTHLDVYKRQGEYESFTNHLMHKHDFIRENVDFMYEKDGVRHCLLVTGEGMEEGVLVESEGSSYARYFAFVPSVLSLIHI